MTADTMSDIPAVFAAPNVIAFTWRSDDNETQWTLYRSTPGNTAPRLQFTDLATGQTSDWGFIDKPRRFGNWGTTPREFAAWCARFAANETVPGLA